jgi:hypothetical protein
MRLFELFSNSLTLLEYSRDITSQKFGTSLLDKFKREPASWQQRIVNAGAEDNVVLDHLLSRIELADPTKNKQYVPWLVRMYLNTPHLKFEDAVSKTTEPLGKFYKLVQKKQIPQPNNDIGRIKDLAGLVRLVDQYPDVEDKPKDVDRGQAKPYYDDADIRVIIPEDQTAACYYGQGTKWCTAAQNNNMFSRYHQEGEMYIIIPKKPAYPGEKYQFHFQTKQFMDEKDHRVNLSKLRARLPQLAKVFANQAKENNVLALDPEISDLPATLQRAVPAFHGFLKEHIRSQAIPLAREISSELGKAVKVFRGLDETYELAEDMLSKRGIADLALSVTNIVRNDPEIVDDEDGLYDELTGAITEFVRGRELWYYVEEVLEELDDEESVFDAAMTIEGEILALLQKLIPKAFADAIETVK